jgi:hypothetical protein
MWFAVITRPGVGGGGGGGWWRRVLEELERQQHLDRVWAKVDADGNGWLDRGELEAVPAATTSPIDMRSGISAASS